MSELLFKQFWKYLAIMMMAAAGSWAADRPTNNPPEKTVSLSAEKTSDKLTDKPSDKPGEKGGDNGEATPLPSDFANFRLVSQRNIFNQNRVSRRRQAESVSQAAPKTVESFALVGTMSYPKGYFAFFDGSSSAYRKTVKPTETIAGYTIKSVTPKGVVLELGTNTIEFHVGMQMRKGEDGSWSKAASDDAVAYSGEGSGADASSSGSGAASGEVNDVLKKLMQKRQQELK